MPNLSLADNSQARLRSKTDSSEQRILPSHFLHCVLASAVFRNDHVLKDGCVNCMQTGPNLRVTTFDVTALYLRLISNGYSIRSGGSYRPGVSNIRMML